MHNCIKKEIFHLEGVVERYQYRDIGWFDSSIMEGENMELAYELNKPNYNNVVYTTEVIVKALDEKLKEGPIPIYTGERTLETFFNKTGSIVGEIIGYSIKNNMVEFDVTLVDSSFSEMKIGLNGFGNVDKNGFVSDYTLAEASILDKNNYFLP